MTWNEFKAKAKKVKDDTVKWSEEHKTEIVIFGPPLIAGVIAVWKGVNKNIQIAQETRRRELDIYDPANGCHLILKKALTNGEKLELDTRRRNGESVTQALYNMGKISYEYFHF